MALLLGSPHEGTDGVDFENAGVLIAVKRTAAVTGTIEQIAVRTSSTGGTSGNQATSLRAAIFSDSAGSPSSRIGNEVTISGITAATTGWFVSAGGAGAAVTSGTTYWICFLSPSGGGQFVYKTNDGTGGAGGSAASTKDSTSTSNASIPASFGTTSGSFAELIDAYAVDSAGLPALPAFRAVGTNAVSANSVANPTNLAPGLPTRSNGDLLLCVTTCRSNSATVSTPSGWTVWPGFPVASGTASGGKIYVFYEVVDGSESAPTVTWTTVATGTTGDSSQAQIFSYSGVDTANTSDGTVPSPTDAAITTPINLPSITTGNPNSLVVGVAMRVNDTAHTFTPPQQWGERADVHTTTGTGHGKEVSDKLFLASGATGTAGVVPSDTTSSRCFAITLAVRAAPLPIPDVVMAPISWPRRG